MSEGTTVDHLAANVLPAGLLNISQLPLNTFLVTSGKSARSLSNIPLLNGSSDPPNLFDGTIRLYVSIVSPFAQRVLSARNFKGLDHIEVLGIDITDKPSWYAEKVYPPGKVPSLEHNGKVRGESLELLEYLDENFEGPALFPEDSTRKEATKELLQISEKFITQIIARVTSKDVTSANADGVFGPLLDHLEDVLGKFAADGPFLVGQISAADFAYAPFIERFDIMLPKMLQYDLYHKRPRLQRWFQAMSTIAAYTSTRCDPKVLMEVSNRVLK